MPFTSLGAYQGISIPQALVDVAESIKQGMSNGDDVADITETSPLIQLAKATAIAPLERLSNDIGFMLSQAFLDGVVGMNLDKFAEGFGQRRNTASRATGLVRITFKTPVSDSLGVPWVPSGAVTFRSTNGRRFDLAENIVLPVDPATTTTIDVLVRDQQTGAAGNIGADGLAATVTFNDPTYAATWNSNVDSFTNPDTFTGGKTTEVDLPFKTRIRLARSARESATVDGILFTLEQRNIGIESADVLENKTMVGGQDDTVAEQSGTGTASETLDGGPIDTFAFKLTPTKDRWSQHAAFILFADSSLVVDISLHEDSSGEPGAAIDAGQFSVTGVNGAGASNLTIGTFPTALVSYYLGGAVPRDIWVVVSHVSGSGSFDGDNSGSAGDVLNSTDGGANWSNDANINSATVQLIGGVPPKSVRVVCIGGLDQDIGEAIFASKAAGIEDDGTEAVVVQDKQGFTHTINFDRPTEVPLYADLTVKVYDNVFPTSGGEDFIRNLVVQYIGGTDLDGVVQPGLGVSEDFVMDQLITLIGDPDNTDGFHSISVRKVDTEDPPVATGDLTPSRGEIFRIDPADIDVTIVRV